MSTNKNLVKKDKDAARTVLFIIRREILNILNTTETVLQIQGRMKNLLDEKIDDFDKPKEIKSWKNTTVKAALTAFDEAYKIKTDDTSTAAKSIKAFVEVAQKIPDSVEDVETLYEALELKPVDNKHSLLDKRKWGKGKLDLAGDTYSQVKNKIETLKDEQEFRTKTGDVSKKKNDSEATRKIDAQKRIDPQEKDKEIADSKNSDSSGKESKGAEDVDRRSFCKKLNKKLADGHAPKLANMAQSGVQKRREGSNKAAGGGYDLQYTTGENQKMLAQNNELMNSMKDVITEFTSSAKTGNNGTQKTGGELNQGTEKENGTAEIDRNEKVARPEITQTAPETGKKKRKQTNQLKKQQKKESKERRKEEKKKRKEDEKRRRKEKKIQKNNKKQLA